MFHHEGVEAVLVAEVESLGLPLIEGVHHDHLGDHDAGHVVQWSLAVIAFQGDHKILLLFLWFSSAQSG